MSQNPQKDEKKYLLQKDNTEGYDGAPQNSESSDHLPTYMNDGRGLMSGGGGAGVGGGGMIPQENN